VEISLAVLKSQKPAKVSDVAWATALGIAYLGIITFIFLLYIFYNIFAEIKLRPLQDAWEMAVKKSKSFVAKHRATQALDKAREVVQN
jgi:hypothetical protein